MPHPWLTHLPFTTSTSSSSFTPPSTAQEHAALREHPVHHAHLQAPSVDKLRHQESLWREDLQSGGNPPITTTHLPNHLAHGVYWRSHAGDLLPVRRWKCRPVDVLARRMLHERDVRPQECGTAPIRSAGTPTRRGRTSARAKGTGYGTEHPNRPAPGQGGLDSILAALLRETNRNRIGTEQHEFLETPIGFDGRGHLHDSDGSKTVKTILAVLESSRGRTTRRILSRTWEPGGGWLQQDKLLREQPMASGQKRRWGSGARQFLAMAALQLGTHLAYDGGWNRIQQP